MAATVAIQLLPHHSPYSHIRQCQTLRTYHVEIEGKEHEDEHESFDVDEVLSRVSTPYGHIRTVQQKSKQKESGKQRSRAGRRDIVERQEEKQGREGEQEEEGKASDPVSTDRPDTIVGWRGEQASKQRGNVALIRFT